MGLQGGDLGMEFFKKYFSEVDNWENEEVKVLCPFHSL